MRQHASTWAARLLCSARMAAAQLRRQVVDVRVKVRERPAVGRASFHCLKPRTEARPVPLSTLKSENVHARRHHVK